MARDHARIELSIWDDPDFVALSAEAQRLYLFLLSQRDLSYAGLVPMRLRRWAGRSATITADTVTAALAELDAARFVVCDHDTEEVLVRSLIRRDGIYKQPNVLAAALREAFAISSPVLRRALADELTRLPVEVTGSAPEVAASALLAGAAELPPSAKAALTGRRPTRRQPEPPHAERLTEPSVVRRDEPAALEPETRAPNPSVNRSGNPSPNPFAEGLGEGSGESGEPSVALVDQQVGVRAPARAHARRATITRPDESVSVRQCRQDEARRLVRTHSPAQPARVLAKLTTEVVGLLGDGVDPAHIAAGLRVWASKRLSTSMLPELVGEYMRAELLCGEPERVRSDADTVATFERLRATCHTGGDRSPVADVVLGDHGDHVPVAQLAELMTDAAHRALAVVA